MTFVNRSRYISIALLAGALGLVAQASAQPQKAPTEQELRAQGARQLTGAEIRSTHIGNTLYHLNVRNGIVIPIYYRDERTRKAKLPDGKTRESVWWLEGDRRCEESVIIKDTVCSRFYRVGGELRACVERWATGTCDVIIRIVPGNPENL